MSSEFEMTRILAEYNTDIIDDLHQTIVEKGTGVRRVSTQKYHNIVTVEVLELIAELHARAKRERGRSTIAKEIYPSQKIW